MKKSRMQLAIVLLFGLILSACDVRIPEPPQFPTKDEAFNSSYVKLEELYKNFPTNVIDNKGWAHGAEKYEGKLVRGIGRIDAIIVYPNEGKFFLIISIYDQDNLSQLISTQLVFLVEDADSYSLGEKEGLFFVNNIKPIQVGNAYDFEGKVSQLSRFDNDLVRSGYDDLVIIQGKLRDINISSFKIETENSKGASRYEDVTPSAESLVIETPPSIQTAIFPQELSEKSISPIWDNNHISCEGKPIYMWGLPGTYLYKVTNQNGENYYVTVEKESVLMAPNDDQCKMPWPDFGNSLLESPEMDGQTFLYYDFCEFDHSRPSGSVSITFGGVEKKTVAFGTYNAEKLDSIQNYIHPNPHRSHQGSISTSEWYACGIGLIYSHTSHTGIHQYRSFQTEYGLELISFTPATTNLSLTRFILVDIQLENLADVYRSDILSEEIALALRLWDAGIRVENIEKYERIVIDGRWQIVYKGTEKTIEGTDVVLTSD